jgi:hypothetical protein
MFTTVAVRSTLPCGKAAFYDVLLLGLDAA